MKILFITNCPSPYRVDFFNEWGQMPDVRLTVLFLEHPGEQKDIIRDEKWFNTDYHYFEAVFLQNKITFDSYIIFKDIFKWLTKEYDGIIFGGYAEPTFMVAMEYLKIHHIPFGIEVDGGIINNNESWLKYQIKKHFLSSADFYFSSGKVASSDYLMHYGADYNKIITYHFTSMTKKDLEQALGPVSFAGNSEQNWHRIRVNCRQRARKVLDVKEPIMSLSIGRLVYLKGFDLLIDLIPQLDTSIGYYFIGGKADPKVYNFIKKNNLTNVHLLDFKTPKELSVYFRAADLFVLPTRHDEWGLVVSEAMAYGLPVVTTDLCGAGLELIEEGKNGVLCHAGDKSSLYQAMNKVMNMDLVHMGFESYKKIQNYTIENTALTHFNYFKSKKV